MKQLQLEFRTASEVVSQAAETSYRAGVGAWEFGLVAIATGAQAISEHRCPGEAIDALVAIAQELAASRGVALSVELKPIELGESPPPFLH